MKKRTKQLDRIMQSRKVEKFTRNFKHMALQNETDVDYVTLEVLQKLLMEEFIEAQGLDKDFDRFLKQVNIRKVKGITVEFDY